MKDEPEDLPERDPSITGDDHDDDEIPENDEATHDELGQEPG